ncbi:Putative hem-containing dehydratase [Septoria linicola]|uniref:Hem-containing dehydratase n=1 Tax=Septoria linicola TaxID=215465 RepID=A0A9Q9AQ01_9PEZI|nr:Putative hem-containing dehydratase [Septoria linicola]
MGSIGQQEERTYPLKRPKGHKPPVTRWTLRLSNDVSHVHTLYVGVQGHHGDCQGRKIAEDIIGKVLDNNGQPPVIDTFRVTNGFDLVDSKVWVAYWTQQADFEAALQQLNLTQIWQDLGDHRMNTGLWIEHFTAPVERLETNYARLDHKPGLARLPNVEQPEHGLTAYWGAGRDRIPASAHDLFETPKDIPTPTKIPSGYGERLTGTNYDNMCHIRSGQWWALCSDPERISYETNLQEKLMGGMNFLWDNPLETGTIGLRFLQNLDDQGGMIRETCGAGFHKNWKDLERWSSRHPSHLAIFNGMMAHAKEFGEGRKLMTWHEVWIFKAGEAHFDYVNCDPKTGVIKWVELDREPLPTA